jgi:nucleoside-diphosphate-sugar epimerase
MEVFITGGTGYIGRAVVAELSHAGHHVVALNRSPDKIPLLNALGAAAHTGDLLQPQTYRDVAVSADAVIHAGFDYTSVLDADRLALDVLLGAITGREAALIYTSGLWVVGETGGKVLGDDAPTDRPASIVEWRVPHEAAVRRAAENGARATVLRAGYVYGGAGGLFAKMFQTAVDDGAAHHVGDGDNHWSVVHVEDLARLYRLVAEKRAAGVVQAVDGTPMPLRDIAAAVSRAAGAEGRTKPIPLDVAVDRMGAKARAMALDQRLSAPAARALGWVPRYASFADGAAAAFQEWKDSRTPVN